MSREKGHSSPGGRFSRIASALALVLWLALLGFPLSASAQSASDGGTDAEDSSGFDDYGQISLDQLPEGEADVDQYKGAKTFIFR